MGIYFRYGLSAMVAVVTAAVFQHLVVLGVDLSPARLIIPGLVGLGFGLLVARIRDLSSRHRSTAERLVERERTILDLNRELESTVESRTVELRETERLLFQLFENSADGIVFVKDSGLIELVNPAMTRLTGLDRESLQGARIEDLHLLEPDDALRLEEAVRSVRDGAGGERRNLTLTIVRNDGTRRVAEAIIQFARPSEMASATGVQIMVRDLSDMQRAEELEDRLRQAQKMESIGRLAGGVAHDFNNILTVVMAGTALLRERLPEGSPLWEDAVRVLEAGQRGVSLTRQLLAFSRRQVLKKNPLDLGAIVLGVTAMLKPLLGNHIVLLVKVNGRGWYIEADRTQIEQVVLNLAVNARDAMPDGGTLSIELSRHLRRIHGSEVPQIRITVKDTGVGMDAETQAHAFEPFFTTKGQDQGTGLGLATVHGIVRQSGGDIVLDSKPGRGTTFMLDFPATDKRPEEMESSRTQSQGNSQSGIALLVEDDSQVRAVTQRMLEAQGWRVLVANSAKSALQIWAAEKTEVDLLVSDVIMPGSSGVRLTAELRKDRADLKVLLISGYPTGELPLAEQGAVPVLGKPFSLEELRGAIQQTLARD